MRPSDRVCGDICATIRRRLGLELAGSMPKDLDHAIARIRAAFPGVPVESLAGYLAALGEGSREWAYLVDLLTIGETYFFRDTSWFDALEAHVIQPLIEGRRRQANLQLRVWSAGCATGEEPYSVAMLLDRLLPDRRAWSIRILATDANSIALETARRGVYRAWSFRGVPAAVTDRHFQPCGEGLLELDPAIRRMVEFVPLNLVGDAADCDTSAMDVIICRNVIMYFAPAAQRTVSARLASSLGVGGWLLTSSAEAWAELFQPLSAVHLPGLTGFRPAGATDPAETAPGLELPVSQEPLAHGRGSRLPQMSGVTSSTPMMTARDDGKSPDHAIAQARVLADRGDYAGACALCEDGLARAALDYDGHLLHAQICQELGNREAARKALRRSLYLRPDSVAAHFLLGNLYESDGEHESARRCMRNVVDLAVASSEDRSEADETDGDAQRLLEAAKAFLQTRHSERRGRHADVKHG